MIWIPFLILIGLFAGRVKLPRLIRWTVLILLVGGAHFLLLDADPILRMIGICTVLLGGMKGLVYAEWGSQLSLGRYLVFGLCWFGMDPGTFAKRRENLSWKEDVWIGAVLMLIGTLGALLVWKMEWRQILVMFLPMSLGFHFGALRVLKGVLRAKGFAVRTLFPNLLKAKGIADFWSRRWNIGYSQMMQRIVGRHVGDRLGREVGVMTVFLVSGLLHELAITLPVGEGFGLPTVYFVGHGFLVLLEGRIGNPLGKIPALLAVGVPLGFLFPPAFRDGVIARCLDIFQFCLS